LTPFLLAGSASLVDLFGLVRRLLPQRTEAPEATVGIDLGDERRESLHALLKRAAVARVCFARLAELAVDLVLDLADLEGRVALAQVRAAAQPTHAFLEADERRHLVRSETPQDVGTDDGAVGVRAAQRRAWPTNKLELHDPI
jgi:hypothetical protein